MIKQTMLIVLVLFICSCDKIKYYPDQNIQQVNTRILAHKAGGGEFSLFQENSMEAAKNSLVTADGIEVDVQISKNKTVWLSHNAYLPECGGIANKCFPETFDYQITDLDSCNGNILSYTRLEDIFRYMSENYPEKYISLDVKAWTPCSLNSADVTGVMNVIADQIISITGKYNMANHVMVESETASFLNYMKRYSSGIECYLTSLGDFERAMLLSLESGYTGISFKYKFGEEISADHIQLIHRKGLKIQLWTVDTPADIEEAVLLNPDFIQTDNMDYFYGK